MTPLSITLIGDQPAIVLTSDLLEQLNASTGDEVQAIATANGIELVTNAEVASQLEAARQVMRDDHQALGKIAIEVMDRRRDALRRLAE